MKKALSRSLVLSVLATSVVLVNCQKAPSRGVKAKGSQGTSVNNTVSAADLKKMQVCNDAINSVLKTQNETYNKISQLINVADAQFDQTKSDELNKLTETLSAQCADAEKAFKDARLTTCKVDNSGSQSSVRTLTQNKNLCADTGTKVSKKTKVNNALAEEAAKNRTSSDSSTKVSSQTGNIFETGTIFEISKDLASLLDSNNKSEAAYIAGQPFNGSESFSGAISQGKTVCKIATQGESLSEGAKLKVLSTKSNSTASGTLQVDINLGSVSQSDSSSLYAITCSVAKKEVSQATKAILEAMGENLKKVDSESSDAEVNSDQLVKAKAQKTTVQATKAQKAVATSEPAVATTATENTKADAKENFRQSELNAQQANQSETSSDASLTTDAPATTAVSAKTEIVKVQAQSDLEKAQAAVKAQEAAAKKVEVKKQNVDSSNDVSSAQEDFRRSELAAQKSSASEKSTWETFKSWVSSKFSSNTDSQVTGD